MAKVKAKRERKPRSKQPFLHESMEPPCIPDLDAAADIYFDAMQERCKLSKEEDEAKQNLIAKMIEHGETLYTTKDGLVVSILSKNNVKVKKKADGESNGESHED